MTLSPISQWLRQALDSTAILSRAGWACVLGISPDALSQVLAGDTVPDARTLRSIFLILQDHESDAARRACERWHELASRPLREAHPTARSEALTLAHYVLGPLWEDHRLAVAALPAHEQEQLLQNGIYEATRWAIARNRAAAGLPLILSDDDLWAHAAAPNELGCESSPDGSPESSPESPLDGAKDAAVRTPTDAAINGTIAPALPSSIASSVAASVNQDLRPRKQPLPPREQSTARPAARSSSPPQPMIPGVSPVPDELADAELTDAGREPRLARSSSPALDARKEPSASGRYFPRPNSPLAARTVAILRDRPPLHHRLPNPPEPPREAPARRDKRRDE